MENAIKYRNITKYLQEKLILNDITFDIFSNEITAFLGPNGAGKTTTLKVGAGLLNVDSGNITFNNEPINKNKDVMFISDTPLLYEDLTAIEFIQFIIELFSIKVSKENLREYIQMFQLGNELNKPLSSYSLGMKKKVILLSFLLRNPKVLLLDEFISGIDPINLRIVKQMLKEFASKGNIVLLSTHQLEVAQSFCDRVILINDGNIVNKGINVSEITGSNRTLEDFFIESVYG
ncbi:ABC transporter ATP-binding protein [Bacillus cereus]|uniref:ABC transporter ATP-binding protein n=1 Tax=Bacillus cereus TaxID=1396 RepID=UPI0024BC5470|nr:ABC transporter ATP-binding protein [Bacillus cereus]WHT85439.1 ABC transporter ATP-binding protein [Bacillus cereus]